MRFPNPVEIGDARIRYLVLFGTRRQPDTDTAADHFCLSLKNDTTDSAMPQSSRRGTAYDEYEWVRSAIDALKYLRSSPTGRRYRHQCCTAVVELLMQYRPRNWAAYGGRRLANA
jgi:hypothetical protein